MDDIYKDKTKEEIIDLVYTLHLQNTSGRETPDEMFRLGIEACYEELCEVCNNTCSYWGYQCNINEMFKECTKYRK
ncbi:MAG: hypothetical protein PF569_01910 [Candidatus Woesearchaeota archaeon]|jgi:hypothetical protein|nr:hypothetical protein [Candidatus Woesearchaeota archaeon]